MWSENYLAYLAGQPSWTRSSLRDQKTIKKELNISKTGILLWLFVKPTVTILFTSWSFVPPRRKTRTRRYGYPLCIGGREVCRLYSSLILRRPRSFAAPSPPLSTGEGEMGLGSEGAANDLGRLRIRLTILSLECLTSMLLLTFWLHWMVISEPEVYNGASCW